MNIRAQEDDLFSRWKAHLRGLELPFATDGAVDPELYATSSPKILFLLKEVNGTNDGFCLRDFLLHGGRRATWTKAARWIAGIRGLPDEKSWELVSNINDEERCRLLRTVAAVNLKKIPGGHTSNPNEVWQAAERDADYIREQFDIYSAELVICCGTDVGKAFDKFIRPSTLGETWKPTARGVGYREYAR